MGSEEKTKTELTDKELKTLRNELWVVIPFFLAALFFFLGSFGFKKEAADVPMVIGGATLIMVAMRLYHIIFPHSKIGEFREAGLAGEFDQMKDRIEEETLKGRAKEEEGGGKEITFAVERKAFVAIIICFLIYLLFGYIAGSFITVIFCCYYYDYKEKLPIAVILASLFVIVYVVLYKVMEAPEDFGMLLTPILEKLELIN
jgi:hypothetical protein